MDFCAFLIKDNQLVGEKLIGKSPMLYLVFIFFIAILFYAVLRSRNLDIWFLSYIAFILKKFLRKEVAVTKVYFCIADHYEPYWGKANKKDAIKRVSRWHEELIPIAKKHIDSEGNHPLYSFFYPAEEYDSEAMNMLQDIVKQGFGDMEIHLHHEDDTPDNLRKDLVDFASLLENRHKLLRRNESDELVYAFIHGNWALDNSHPEGLYCGIDNELEILTETGCYMDMTMPSAPCRTQTSKINSIYFAKGEPGKCKSHNHGDNVKPGRWKKDGELLMVQGPLGFNWKSRKLGILPRIEAGELSHDAPPSEERIKLWINYGARIESVDDHVFIKLHTHGANDRNLEMLLEGGLDSMWSSLESMVRDNSAYSLHYVSARGMYCKIKELALKTGS